MLNSAGIFTSNRVVLTTDQKPLGKKRHHHYLYYQGREANTSGSGVTFPAPQSCHQSQLDLPSHSLTL